jgi:glycerol-1-phosphate dehydrogenase [NAD(P)+]
MPLFARMLAAPLVIDVRPGAIADLGALLADRRIATEGRIAVAVGPGQGDSIAAELEIEAAQIFRVPDGTHAAAAALGQRLRAGAY